MRALLTSKGTKEASTESFRPIRQPDVEIGHKLIKTYNLLVVLEQKAINQSQLES